MTSPPLLWLTEADVVSTMDMADAIEALERGLIAEAQGEALNMTKTHLAWGRGSTLHAIGAAFPIAGFAGTKTWAHTTEGATPLLILFDASSGALRAVIEAFALGQLRTGSASGVATRWLAAPGADTMALVGTGRQALSQVAAVLAVRPLARLRVFGRDRERLAQFVGLARETFDLEITAADDVTDAVRGAPIITLATRATDPFLRADMIAPGAHINAIGAITPAGAEVAGDALTRCTRIVVDSVPQAQRLSRELLDHFHDRPEGWEQAQSLATVVAARGSRAPGEDLTLFKSLGMGISDLSLGIEIYHRALGRGLGRSLPHPQRALPRLVSAGTVQQGGR